MNSGEASRLLRSTYIRMNSPTELDVALYSVHPARDFDRFRAAVTRSDRDR